jgi:hypothetical protein
MRLDKGFNYSTRRKTTSLGLLALATARPQRRNLKIFCLFTWTAEPTILYTSGVRKSQAAKSVVLRIELASCHRSGAYNSEMAPTSVENLYTPVLLHI